ncbi:MAG TPA: lipase maturation factor family protein [Candidatus Binatia bacterium]|nr:lipase maturation factor family protein [Candidatus Binatia bacterium]
MPARAYVLTRFAVLRLLGLVYAVAFLVLVRQGPPLLGSGGLLPAAAYLARVHDALGARAYLELPTLFWIDCSDATLRAAAWLGLGLSLAALLGVTNALLQLALWALYLSFVQVGQVFWGYGWETQLCETGFLAVFLCPMRTLGPFSSPPPAVVVWLLRWLIARIMLGAGLIKLRGDPCWRRLTCLVWHYETQPVPNPVSWLLAAEPRWLAVVGALFNFLVELVVPWFVFGPRRLRTVAGILLVAFQATLIASGNLSFLNWLTIVPALACFDDGALGRLCPRRLRAWIAARTSDAVPSRAHRGTAWALAALVTVLSVAPVRNLLSPRQAMNASFDPLHLVNTYGAFGSVGRVRDEVILEGTRDERVGPDTRWQEYELPCKPGDVHRRPCVISPYHYRLDWQMWFAAMSSVEREPWLLHLVFDLLCGAPGVRSLFAVDPFAAAPPRWVRAELYRYRFTRPGEGSPDWWARTRVGTYVPPVSTRSPELRAYLRAHGWRDVCASPPG